jgi:Uma2 family endonuclease
MEIAMSVRTTATPELKNFAELLERLGGISPERVRLKPWPGTATIKDVVDVDDHEDRLCELVDGVLVEKIIGFTESRIAIIISAALETYAAAHDLGLVVGEAGMFRLPDNLVRIPDVAFARWEQFPNRELPAEAVPAIVPDLAVEILSKGNTKAEMTRKLREYFAAGSQLVWFVDPTAKTVTVHSSPTRSKVLTAAGSLDGGKLLPGFKLPVSNLFANLGRAPKKRK